MEAKFTLCVKNLTQKVVITADVLKWADLLQKTCSSPIDKAALGVCL